MIHPDVFAPPQTPVVRVREQMNGLTRLFAAAIVNHQFREALLREPRAALVNGYPGQTEPLSEDEKMLITSIRAESLSDLAKQVNWALKNGR
ncbi:MAG TPA: hypothetical protein VIU39_02170 [Anaerolineales bacterium]|jgi:hypothetical protein